MEEQRKYNVLFVMNALNTGGAEHALLDLMRMLSPDRFSLYLLVGKSGGDMQPQFEALGFPIRECVNPKPLPSSFLRRKLMAVIKRLKYKLMPDCDENPIRLGAKLFGVSFDLVVDYSMVYNLLGCTRIAPKTITYLHSDMLTHADFAGWENKQSVLEDVAKVICVSERAKQSFDQVVGLPDKSVLLYNPLYAEGVLRQSEAPMPIPVEGDYICVVGRVSPEKGTVRMAYLYDRLRKAGVQAKLVIVGDGRNLETLRYMCRGLRYGDDVILTGNLANPHPYMRHAKLLVIPSYTEGLPVVATEALCLGTPVVSSYPSVAELFGGEACGMITDGDDESLYAGVLEMLTDDALYARTKEAAVRRSQQLSGDEWIRKVEDLYLDVIRG